MSMKNYNVDYYSLMHYKYKRIGLFILIIIGLIACKSALYIPTAENVVKNSNIVELKQGRMLYAEKCSSCHSLRLPEKYTKDQWEKNVNKMAPRAKITEEEKQLILAYVTKGE